MASTGSIGTTRPIKKVTQVNPRKVSATENSRLTTRRMGPARHRTHLSGADTAAVPAVTGDKLCLGDRPEEVEVLDKARLVALDVAARGDLVGRLEHQDIRPLVG